MRGHINTHTSPRYCTELTRTQEKRQRTEIDIWPELTREEEGRKRRGEDENRKGKKREKWGKNAIEGDKPLILPSLFLPFFPSLDWQCVDTFYRVSRGLTFSVVFDLFFFLSKRRSIIHTPIIRRERDSFYISSKRWNGLCSPPPPIHQKALLMFFFHEEPGSEATKKNSTRFKQENNKKSLLLCQKTLQITQTDITHTYVCCTGTHASKITLYLTCLQGRGIFDIFSILILIF